MRDSEKWSHSALAISTLSSIMLKKDETCFKNLGLLTPQDFEVCLAIFQHA